MRKADPADSIRDKLKHLRLRLERKEITPSEHAALSARLLHELKTLDASKPRYAKC
jgi:hypothetical protein